MIRIPCGADPTCPTGCPACGPVDDVTLFSTYRRRRSSLRLALNCFSKPLQRSIQWAAYNQILVCSWSKDARSKNQDMVPELSAQSKTPPMTPDSKASFIDTAAPYLLKRLVTWACAPHQAGGGGPAVGYGLRSTHDHEDADQDDEEMRAVNHFVFRGPSLHTMAKVVHPQDRREN